MELYFNKCLTFRTDRRRIYTGPVLLGALNKFLAICCPNRCLNAKPDLLGGEGGGGGGGG